MTFFTGRTPNKENFMSTKRKVVALAVLATTALTFSDAFAQRRDRDGRHGSNDFRVCKPYRMTVETLSTQLNNFEDEVLAPLQRRLDDQRRRVSQRISEESKIEGAIRDINRRITSSERRLNSIPGLIIANNNSIKASQAKIPQLEAEIKKLQAELDDAGWLRRAKLKMKIKARKNDIQDERKNIERKTRENANMESERNNLPGQISSLRGQLLQAQVNLDAHRNQTPSLDQLRDEEIRLRDQVDSQEDLRATMRRDLEIGRIELDKCVEIRQDAMTYRELMKMARRIRAAECDVELVRSRLPYNMRPVEQRAFNQAAKLICEPITDEPGTGNNQ
jgi:chromosome segregation ATPase